MSWYQLLINEMCSIDCEVLSSFNRVYRSIFNKLNKSRKSLETMKYTKICETANLW